MDISKNLESTAAFRRVLTERFFLRWHMSLILFGAFLSGLVATKVLLLFHVNSMLIRYPVAVLCSYLAFFGLVKLWLLYVSSSASEKVTEKVVHGLWDFAATPGGRASIPDLPVRSGETSSPEPTVSGGGGAFGGGGVTGSFFDEAGTPDSSSSQASPSPLGASGGGSLKAVGETTSEAALGIGKDAAKILFIIGILLSLIFGAGAYLIYQAPVILSEAAFEAVLATSLVKGMKKMDTPEWMGSVFRTTVVPFALVLAVAVAIAALAQRAHPSATKLSEVILHLLVQ